MMKRCIFIAGILLTLIAQAVFGGSSRPNMVVVLVDDHAFEAISAYGSYLKDYARTPAIDRLAKEGMRFDNFTCCNSICSPSRAAILTGQYSHKNGVLGLNGSIHEGSPQYPVELQKAGYQTWVVGKWHLGSQPKEMQGRSMVPLLKGESVADPSAPNGSAATGWRKSQFYTYWGAPPNHHGIRTDRYTYVKMKNHPAELFDRKTDPDQLHNVAGNPENKPVIARLEKELKKQIREVDISRKELPGGAR